MPVFGRRSQNALNSAHRDLKVVMSVAIKLYDFSVLEGHRKKERQDELFEEEATFLRWPHSKHNSNPSMAVDVAPYPIDWGDHKRFYYLAGLILVVAWILNALALISHEVAWGGDWDRDQDFGDQEFHDLGHFELVSKDERIRQS